MTTQSQSKGMTRPLQRNIANYPTHSSMTDVLTPSNPKKRFSSLRNTATEFPTCPGTPDRFGNKSRSRRPWSFHKVLALQANEWKKSSRRKGTEAKCEHLSFDLHTENKAGRRSPGAVTRDRIQSEPPPDSPLWKQKNRFSFITDRPEVEVGDVGIERFPEKIDEVSERSRSNSESKSDLKKKWTQKLSLSVAKLSLRKRFSTGNEEVARKTMTNNDVNDSADRRLSDEKRISPLTPVELTGSQTVVVVGAARTGKSTLISRLKACGATKDGSGFLSTTTSDVLFLEVNNKKDDLWQSLTASAYLVIFAQDDALSMDNAISCIRLLKTRRQNIRRPTILIANKADAYKKVPDALNVSSLAARSCQTHFVETAALLNQNVENLSIILHAELMSCLSDSENESRSLSPSNRTPNPKQPISGRVSVSKSPISKHTDSSQSSGNRMSSLDIGGATGNQRKKKLNRDKSLTNCFARRRNSRSCEDILMLFNETGKNRKADN